MTLRELVWVLLGGLLLVCIGILLGTAWAMQALQAKLCHQARERRRLNDERAALQAIRHQLMICPHCGLELGPRHGPPGAMPAESPPDDD